MLKVGTPLRGPERDILGDSDMSVLLLAIENDE